MALGPRGGLLGRPSLFPSLPSPSPASRAPGPRRPPPRGEHGTRWGRGGGALSPRPFPSPASRVRVRGRMMGAHWEERSDKPPPPRASPGAPIGARGRPMPHPAGTGRATEGEVGNWSGGGALASCFFIGAGGKGSPPGRPSLHQSHPGEEQPDPRLPVHAPPSFLLFSFSLPKRVGAGTRGTVPGGFVTRLLPVSLT